MGKPMEKGHRDSGRRGEMKVMRKDKWTGKTVAVKIEQNEAKIRKYVTNYVRINKKEGRFGRWKWMKIRKIET